MAQREKRAQRQFREGVEDFTATPDRLRRMIDQGICGGVVNFHSVDRPGEPSKLAMISGGLTQREIFDAVCVIRRSMMMMLGFTEATPIGGAASGDLVADDEPIDPGPIDPRNVLGIATGKAAGNPNPCQACGRDYWQVLAKCEHVGCPKGLYAP